MLSAAGLLDENVKNVARKGQLYSTHDLESG